MNKRIKIILTRLIILVFCPLSLLLLPSCDPEAHWTTSHVKINMHVENISAGFAECSFVTNKEAYYLVGITPAREDNDPTANEQLFMQQMLDSIYTGYLDWQQSLEEINVSPIAPFSSHSLQYGTVTRFFTGLIPDTEYCIYAFVVNPDKREPAGTLYIERVRTLRESQMNIHFDYRVKGYWDYIYPINEDGFIEDHFPYVATTRDSLDFAAGQSSSWPQIYFDFWLINYFVESETAPIHYGVKAIFNDGFTSYLEFVPGHTYYTCISGYDGGFLQMYLYKFTWTGEDFEAYFTDEDNLISHGKNE